MQLLIPVQRHIESWFHPAHSLRLFSEHTLAFLAVGGAKAFASLKTLVMELPLIVLVRGR